MALGGAVGNYLLASIAHFTNVTWIGFVGERDGRVRQYECGGSILGLLRLNRYKSASIARHPCVFWNVSNERGEVLKRSELCGAWIPSTFTLHNLVLHPVSAGATLCSGSPCPPESYGTAGKAAHTEPCTNDCMTHKTCQMHARNTHAHH